MSRTSKQTTTTVLGELGSGNVFADLGLPNPEEEFLKAKLVAKIAEVIERREMTQAQAGEVIGLPQSKVSELCNGRTESYSVERLYRLLTRIGVGISVVLEEQPDWTRGSVEVVESPDNGSDRDYDIGQRPAPGM